MLTISKQSATWNPDTLNQVVTVAVTAALTVQKLDFMGEMNKLREQFDSACAMPKVKIYELIRVDRSAKCAESLDALSASLSFLAIRKSICNGDNLPWLRTNYTKILWAALRIICS